MQKLTPMAAGQRFGRLVAIEFVGRNKHRQAMWRFRCDCGGETMVRARHVQEARTLSCGCLLVEVLRETRTTHGMAAREPRRTAEYRVWGSMLTRCNNPKSKSFRDYGDRGIRVCERWEAFENFFADMGLRPSSDYSINRIDNDGNYEPGNCEWATRHDQALNRRPKSR